MDENQELSLKDSAVFINRSVRTLQRRIKEDKIKATVKYDPYEITVPVRELIAYLKRSDKIQDADEDRIEEIAEQTKGEIK